jgi:uncharacterized protein (DUF1501 family)
MKRRNFLKGMMYGSAAMSSGAGLILPSQSLFAATLGNTTQRSLINTMLLGGADLRFLFVPEPGTPYAEKFWQARQGIYQDNLINLNLYQTYEAVWDDLYLPVSASDGSTFGIHKNAAWLKAQYDLGNVAIVANVVASTNRRHDHSQLIVQTGDLQADQYLLDRDGWGGRLVGGMATPSNVVALNHDMAIFCNSTNPGNRLDHAIHMRDSRSFNLPHVDGVINSQRSVMARTLKAYYAKRGEDIESQIRRNRLPEDWPYRKFFQHESAIRQFGDSFAARLDEVMPTQPYLLQYLYKYSSSYRLKNSAYGKEIANLYDALLGADLLSLRAAYMEISGWDTHRLEKNALEKNLKDMFGVNAGMDLLTRELDKILGINENMVYTFTSDFGRQIAANGDKGTDHGTATYMMVIGRSVNGGTYGEMFPQREITPDANGQIPFDVRGADIKGLTSFERVLAEVCDWVEPGSGVTTFPNTAKNDLSIYPDGPILEPGVDLGTLFKPGHFIVGKIASNADNPLLSYDFPGMQVTVTGPNGYTVTVPVENYTYHIGPVAEGQYTVRPDKPYINFDPPETVVQMAGENIVLPDFIANPTLQFSDVAKTSATYPDPVSGALSRGFRGIGHHLLPNETTLTIGGVNIPIFRSIGSIAILTYVPIDIVAGEIRLSTPTETYVHPVPYEDIPTI